MKLNDVAPSNTSNAAKSAHGTNGVIGVKGKNVADEKKSVKSASQRQHASFAPAGNTAFADAFAKLKDLKVKK
jgi:hypothetical protein